MANLDTTLLKCPKSEWTIQPINVDEPFEIAGKWFAWWDCPACDRDEHIRGEAGYNPAHPGPHLLPLTPTSAPREWRSKWPWEGMQP